MSKAELSVKLALAARTAELQAVIASSHVTDAAGVSNDLETALSEIVDLLVDLRARRGRLYVIGNGGSAAVASHAVTDFVNVGRIQAATLHDSSLLTCMANDHGYENAFARVLGTIAEPGDALIAISSSGKSPNICNAAAAVRDAGGHVITLSGFAPENPLRRLGRCNIWLDSRDYGMVEIAHQFVIHNISDRLAARAPAHE
jgi:D-sedoheptulose 7-phosphate isomerase